MSAKRYYCDFFIDDRGDTEARMCQASDGDYVKFEDYDVLKAKLAEEQEYVETLRRDLAYRNKRLLTFSGIAVRLAEVDAVLKEVAACFQKHTVICSVPDSLQRRVRDMIRAGDSADACSECGHSGGTETDMGYSCPTCSALAVATTNIQPGSKNHG